MDVRTQSQQTNLGPGSAGLEVAAPTAESQNKAQDMVEITCPQCKESYQVDVRRIPPDATTVRCKSCDSTFPINIEEYEFELVPDADVQQSTGARTIGVMISKGGVGKTTTAVNLAAGLALKGRKVLLVDTDTQGQCTYILGVKPKYGLAELVHGDIPVQDVLFEARENLFVISGGKSLAGVKRVIDRKDFGGETTLAEALRPLEKDFDYIIVDSSPGWDPLTVNVMFYVKEILTPVSLEVMTLQGLKEFLKNLSAVKKYNPDIALKYIVPTFYDKRIRQPQEILAGLNELYGQFCCPPIHYNVRLSQSPAGGKTIFEFAPDSHGAEDYERLVSIIERNGEQE